VEVGPQTGEPLCLVARQPAVDGIRIAGTQQARARDRVRTHPVGDLQQGAGPLPHLGMGVVIADRDQGLPLLLCQLQCSSSDHGRVSFCEVVPYPAITDLSSEK
jgi:hypothetical protein